jgi:spermidine synthase
MMAVLLPRLALALAFLLSGTSGLVYEIVWARKLSVLVGGTASAGQSVLAAFFAGITLGAFWLGHRAASAKDGARFYARLELGIAGAGVYSAVALETALKWADGISDGSASPRTAAMALGLTLLVCLPATVLMGATFPAIARAITQTATNLNATALLGRAYAANTAGAVVGSFGSAFVLFGLLGVRGTIGLAIGGNLLAAVLVWLWVPKQAVPTAESPALKPQPDAPLSRSIAAALLLSGFVAITLEIIAIRILAVTLSDTIYTFAIAIGAYILGAALAAVVMGRRSSSKRASSRTLVLIALVLVLLWLPLLQLASPFYDALKSFLGTGFVSNVIAESVVGLLVAAPAAFPTTWIYLHLAAHPAVKNPAQGARLAAAWNGIGCTLAPIVCSLVLLPIFGTLGLALLSVALLWLCFAILKPEAERRSTPSGVAIVVTLVMCLAVFSVLRNGLHGFTTTEGWHLVWAREGAGVTVSIEESPAGLRRLRTNNNFGEGGDSAGISQTRQGMFPTLFVRDGRDTRVLNLGVGSGITMGATVLGLPSATFEGVELLPEIHGAVSFFEKSNHSLATRTNVTLHIADARSFAANARARGLHYDLVLGELFHAAQAGTGALYSKEHFEVVRDLLTPTGIYCQWISLQEAPPDQIKTVARTFFAVFAEGGIYLGSWTMVTPILGFCGGSSPLHLRWREVEARLFAPPERHRAAVSSQLARLPEMFAGFVAERQALLQWAGSGPENTDDHPELELGAPRTQDAYLGINNLLALLPIWKMPDGLVDYGSDVNRDSVRAIQMALADFYRGSHAWLIEDLDGAERMLLQANAQAPELPMVSESLLNLAATFKAIGKPERADSLHKRILR